MPPPNAEGVRPKAPELETLIFLGHNGPVGLGDRAEDPVGKDWQPIGGFGDPDYLKRSRRLAPLVKLFLSLIWSYAP